LSNFYSILANAHEVFAISWALNYLSGGSDAADIAAISGSSQNNNTAQDHAVIDKFCGWNDDIVALASLAIADIRG